MKTLLLGLLACLAFPAMANDACTDALPLGCGDVVSGTTAGSTADNAGSCGTSNTSPGVWYTFEGFNGEAILSTCSSASYDTKISVFAGSCTGLFCVGGNDDFSGCSGFTSRVTVPVQAGDTYYVLVHGFGSATGSFNLSMTCSEELLNDDCELAMPIGCGETLEGSTQGATNDYTGSCGVSNTSPGVWYLYEAFESGEVTASTCSDLTNFDTKLSVFSGDCGALVCEAGADDDFSCAYGVMNSSVSWMAEAGREYLILVHGFSSRTGNFELTMSCAAPPANDLPCDAEALELGVPVAMTTQGATADDGEVSPGEGTNGNEENCDATDGWCFFETEVQNSVWYTFTAPESGAVRIITQGFDTQIALWEAGDCGDYGTFAEVAGNDDYNMQPAAGMTVSCLTPGQTYFLQVDGHDGDAGQGALLAEAVESSPMSCNAGGCQTKYIGYAPAEGLNHLIVSVEGGTPPYSYAWTGDGIVTNANAAHISVDAAETTTYEVTVTDALGCQTTCSVDVFVVDVTCSGNGNRAEDERRGGNAPAKIRVCHISPDNPGQTNELCLPPAAVAAHLAHGDVLGGCESECNATNPPPAACVPLRIDITTDEYGEETSWELRDGDGALIASGSGLDPLSDNTVYEECVAPGCYSVTVFDAFGDGMCCEYGNGNWSVTYDGTTTASPSGGTFASDETAWVGSCGSGKQAVPAAQPEARLQAVSEISAKPNPFRGSSVIRVIPAGEGTLTIDVIDVNGQLMARIFEGNARAGSPVEAVVTGNQLVNSGIYLYRVRQGDETLVGKLVYAR